MEAFLYFLFGIVASVLINLATPYIQKKLEGTLLVSKGKRLKALKEEFEQTFELYTNASKFTATVTGDLIFLLSILLIIIVMGTLAIFIQVVALQMPSFEVFRFLSYQVSTQSALRALSFTLHQAAWVFLYIVFLMLGVFVTVVFRISNKVRKVRDYKKYKQEVEDRINSLESIG